MPNEEILDETVDEPSVPTIKIAAATAAAFLIARNLKRRYSVHKEKQAVEKVRQDLNEIFFGKRFADVTPEDIIDGTCTEIK